eukprot:CAMPEP_0198683298 /NCGR_PEP_ID=MMETSP1468-20131203/10360_1 /TAXON_ID=1461545 /ORGANISM="Mantoniella sp, Strain CCMP1436" /LENGTH=288 /DNA_ID=CAMNT_0044427163 /DNA_START=86 /DNA_END=949 /DNA_ORIENTATION=-
MTTAVAAVAGMSPPRRARALMSPTKTSDHHPHRQLTTNASGAYSARRAKTQLCQRARYSITIPRVVTRAMLLKYRPAPASPWSLAPTRGRQTVAAAAATAATGERGDGGDSLDAVAAGDILRRAWAATVIVAPDVTTNIPFLGSSRHGSGVVIAPDGSRVLTAAHVACLAGSRNRLRVRAPTAAGGGEWMTATVVGVHPELDLAILCITNDDGGGDSGGGREGTWTGTASTSASTSAMEMPWLPLARSAPSLGEPVAALGYPMGWAGLFKSVGGIGSGGGKGVLFGGW